MTRYLHPSAYVRDKYPNQDKDWKKNNRTKVIIISQGDKKVNGKEQGVYFMRSEDFPDKQLHAVKKWVEVTQEGPEASIFDAVAESTLAVDAGKEECGIEMPEAVQQVRPENFD